MNYCIYCYEKERGVVLHKHREKIKRGLRSTRILKKSEKIIKTCPTCQSESLTIDKNGKEICRNCEKTLKLLNKLKNDKSKTSYKTETKKRGSFQRENTLEDILNYLKKNEKNNNPLKFWYRDDIKPREVYDYFIDDKYIQVKSDKGYYIKFLIDKIRKI